MFRILIVAFLSIAIILPASMPTAAFAADKDKAAQSTARGPTKQLSTIVFAGVAGAILGLSTLSFYGRPQDKLNNIAIGAAIGIIGGAVYSTFKAATDPHDFYNQRDFAGHELWAMEERGGQLRAPPDLTPHWNLGLSF